MSRTTDETKGEAMMNTSTSPDPRAVQLIIEAPADASPGQVFAWAAKLMHDLWSAEEALRDSDERDEVAS